MSFTMPLVPDEAKVCCILIAIEFSLGQSPSSVEIDVRTGDIATLIKKGYFFYKYGFVVFGAVDFVGHIANLLSAIVCN